MIEKCRFGAMTVRGLVFTSDLKIFPDQRVVDQWRRTKGHHLSFADIDDLVAAEPEVLVIGTGVFGRMKIASELRPLLAARGIELVAGRNSRAMAAYNQLCGTGRRAAAGFHLTC